MTIPAIRVESAPLVPMNVKNNYMELPDNPRDIAWYDFTAKPGLGSNAVFSAHLDYINYGPAVFHDLHELRQGDEVIVRLQDGTRLRYAVTKNEKVPLAGLDVRALIAPTPVEILTLITCAGAFDGQDYSDRVIVLARRTGVEPGGSVATK
jgi:LPXTG-site transpeptidase (sortase) family protein